MAVVTFIVVVLRYVFNLGWIWLQESVVYMHGMLFMAAAGYTLYTEGHVRVDIFYDKMTEEKKAWVDLFGALFLLLPTCFIILYYGSGYVFSSWEILEDSKETGGLPAIFILKSFILIFPVLLISQGASQAIKSLATIADYKPQTKA